MVKKDAKVYIKRNNDTIIDGSANLPQPSAMEYGELAVNYHKGVEVITFKNDANEIVKLEPVNIVQSTGNSTKDIMSQNTVTNALNGKQDKLVSGTNIKTINGASILGEGNITISVGPGGITDANKDGKTYGRKDGAWVEITSPDLSGYLTITSAANTYLSKTDATNTYLSNDTASSTYATITTVNGKANISHTHVIDNITDLNSGWDSILKSAPTAYMIRWPSISEVTNKEELIIKLNNGSTEGTNMFTFDGTTFKEVNITASSINAALSSHAHSEYATTESVSQAINDAAFNNGVTTLTTVSNIAISHRLVMINTTTDQTLSLASIPPSGREINIIIRNTGSNDITITIPSNSTYITPSGQEEAIMIPAGGYADVNIVSDGTLLLVRGA